MREISLERPGFAQATAVSLVTLAALALLGLVLAYWTWHWFGPRIEPPAPVVAEQGVRALSSYGMFGKAQRDRDVAAQAAGPIRLLGVVAAAGGSHGYAVMQLESRENARYAKERISLPACSLRRFIGITSSSRATGPVNRWPGRRKMPARAGKRKTINDDRKSRIHRVYRSPLAACGH